MVRNTERIVAEVIRDANDLIARPRRPLRDTSLTALLSSLDDSRLPGIWKPEAVAQWRRPRRRSDM